MTDLLRFGPELALLIAAGLIIVGDVSLPLGASARRTYIVVPALLGVGLDRYVRSLDRCR
jgi:hypothetical protein